MRRLIKSKTHGNHYFYFDKEDLDFVNKHKWYIHKINDVLYVRTNIRYSTKSTHFHRLLIPYWKQIDHINHNGLDNRRSNLREVNRAQNNMNGRKQKRKTSSKYKGVCYLKTKYNSKNKWLAHIKIQQSFKWLAQFETEDEAAYAYNIAARYLFKEYANENPVKISSKEKRLFVKNKIVKKLKEIM